MTIHSISEATPPLDLSALYERLAEMEERREYAEWLLDGCPLGRYVETRIKFVRVWE